MIQQFLTDNFGLIVSGILGTVTTGGYFYERRRNKALTKGVEADSTSKEIENGSKVVDLYKQALDDLAVRYEKKLQDVIQACDKRVALMQTEITHLESLYQRKNKLLEDELKLKNRFINTLKKEVAELRK